MYRHIFRVITATALFLSPMTAQAQEKTYSNPVISSDCPDPTIWQDGSDFYYLSTGVRSIRHSRDLINWTELPGKVIDETSMEQARSLGKMFWAPDVVRIGDKWMLYLTCYRSAEDTRIAAFSSASPEGPFIIEGTVTDGAETGIRDTIDPEVVADPVDGRIWLFFGSIDGIHRVELSPDGTALCENPAYTHVAGLTDRVNPDRDKVFEGTYLYQRYGWWYLFASAGHYWNHTYRIVVGRSRTLDGVFLDRDGRPMTEGYATTVLSSAEGDIFYGPGHNGEIFTDAQGRDYMLYHCHNTGNEKASVRNTLMQQIFWDEEGWPYFAGGKPAATDLIPQF